MTFRLVTQSEREFLRGERDDVEDPEAYRHTIRARVRDRMDDLEDALDLLREAGEDDLVREFHANFGRVAQLEREVEALREQHED